MERELQEQRNANLSEKERTAYIRLKTYAKWACQACEWFEHSVFCSTYDDSIDSLTSYEGTFSAVRLAFNQISTLVVKNRKDLNKMKERWAMTVFLLDQLQEGVTDRLDDIQCDFEDEDACHNHERLLGELAILMRVGRNLARALDIELLGDMYAGLDTGSEHAAACDIQMTLGQIIDAAKVKAAQPRVVAG